MSRQQQVVVQCACLAHVTVLELSHPLLCSLQELFGNGIFASNGPEWKAHREFARSLFLPDRLRTTVEVCGSGHGVVRALRVLVLQTPPQPHPQIQPASQSTPCLK
jgi:hypothetical protein